jgi:cytochrome oxidase assembly protein ShyY1
VSKKKWIVTLGLLFVLGCLMAALSAWQIRRAHEKIHLQLMYEREKQKPLIDFSLGIVPGGFSLPSQWVGRKVRLKGSLLLDQTIWLFPRSYQERVGSWWIVPLLIKDNEHSFAIPILLGWSPEGSEDKVMKNLLSLQKTIIVEGVLVSSLSSYYQLGEEKENRFKQKWVNFNFDHYQKQWTETVRDISLVQLILKQEQTLSGDINLFPIGGQESSYLTPERHYGYAMVWGSFALIAWVILMVSAFRFYRLFFSSHTEKKQ